MKHPILLLNRNQRSAVAAEIDRLAALRRWHLWARSVRSNHVHVVVSADEYAGSKVRDQLKANCTHVLREDWNQFANRPVWTTGGDWKQIDNENGLEQVITYVQESQDRMEFDDRKQQTRR